MSPSNPSVQVTVDHRIEVKQNAIPILKKGQVLIHPKVTGICGTDLHFWRHGRVGPFEVKQNSVLGHESSGEILAIGEGVTNVKVGDRVAIEPGIPCGKCFLCWKGDYNLCEDVEFIGVVPYSGTMQRYLVHDARFVFKLADNMSYEQGALVEPVSVAYHGIERAELELGKGVLIAGAGPIGLATLLLTKASGSTPIVITDLSKERLNFAKKIVPEVITYQIDTKKNEQENGAAIKSLFGPLEYDAPPRALECTGVESSINTAAHVVRRSGILTIVGVGKSFINNFPFMHLSLAEIDVRFINRYHDSWPTVIKLISNGVIDVDPLVTHRFDLEDAASAFKLANDPANGSIKVFIQDRKQLGSKL